MAALSLNKETRAVASLPRKWLLRLPGPEAGKTLILLDVTAAHAWVKGGHLFVGPSLQGEWTAAWAPGGWLSIELVKD